jgi:hypothetical protein
VRENDRTVTILGCGVAGSWAAHHLCSAGFDRFVLFGGEPVPAYVLEKGPYCAGEAPSGTAAEALADHLRKLNPSAQIEVFGDYVPGRDDDQLSGRVFGVMGRMANCLSAFSAAQTRGLIWRSFGLPSTARGSAKVVNSPHDLDPDEHFGVPALDRASAMFVVASCLQQICEIEGRSQT